MFWAPGTPRGPLQERSSATRPAGPAEDEPRPPDTIVEVPRSRSRYFLEVESGARYVGITTGSVRNSEALVRNLHRYLLYFTGSVEVGSSITWYGKRFSDRLAPEVVVIVHSIARPEAVRVALRRWMAKVERVFRVRVVTLTDAGGVLGSLIAGGNAPRGDKHYIVSERSAVRIPTASTRSLAS